VLPVSGRLRIEDGPRLTQRPVRGGTAPAARLAQFGYLPTYAGAGRAAGTDCLR